MNSRRKGREFALQYLYALDVGGEPSDPEFLRRIIREGLSASLATETYAVGLVETLLAHLQAVDSLLERCTLNWDWNRLSLLDKTLLRCSVAEILFRPEVPTAVVINEAVEISKKYSTENSPGFINGVLDAARRKSASLSP